jgi:hypothetical protein
MLVEQSQSFSGRGVSAFRCNCAQSVIVYNLKFRITCSFVLVSSEDSSRLADVGVDCSSTGRVVVATRATFNEEQKGGGNCPETANFIMFDGTANL